MGSNQQDLFTKYDPTLIAIIKAFINRSTPHRILLMVGGVTIIGEIVSGEAWKEACSMLDPVLQSTISHSPGFASPSKRDKARVTIMQEHLRWGSGLNHEQMSELQAAKAALESTQAATEAMDQFFLHLIAVEIVSGSEVKKLPAWRGRIDRIDGFGFLPLSED
jgi:hypothetical protein